MTNSLFTKHAKKKKTKRERDSGNKSFANKSSKVAAETLHFNSIFRSTCANQFEDFFAFV